MEVGRHGSWEVLGGGRVDITGRLIGGCIETLDGIAGTAYGNVARFGEEHGPLLEYLEASGSSAFDICRALHHLRLSGWFDAATGVLIGRTDAPDDWRDILRRERLRVCRPHARSGESTFRLQ